jgi:RNA polymerase sigma factor (sigma-70 family)
MAETNDIALLREYLECNSETAFAELVHRHVNLVYSVALRATGNSHDAQDVTQAVFVIFAKKATTLRQRTNLTGWLYETTRFTSSQILRTRARQQAREQEAYMQSTLNDSETDTLWRQLAPLLEDAMSQLSEKDRTLVALRFFENKSVAETAVTLGIREWAARKRAERAMEKLRDYFGKRGIASTAATLAGVISANSIQAAPAMLVKAATVTALAKGATASASTLTLIKGALKVMTWAKAKTAIITGTAVLVAIGGGAAIYEVQQKKTASVPTDGPADMRIKWVVGKKYECHWELNQNSETKSPDQSQPVQEGLKWTQDCNMSALKEIPNGGRQLELEFVKEAMDESQGGHTVLSFDSSQNQAANKHNRLAILSAMIGARIEFFIDADGKVQRVEGVKELANHIAAVGTPQQQQVFNGMFGEDNLKNYLSFQDMMPNRIVNVGESWSLKKDIADNIGVLTEDTKYTFKKWEQYGGRKCAHIEETGTLSSKTVSTASGAMVKIEKGTFSGDTWFDPEVGMIVGGNENEDLILKITTRTQTMTKQTHDKMQWALLNVE